MTFIEFNFRIKKIINFLGITLQNYENHEIHKIPCQNNVNHENIIVPLQKHENNENHRISFQNNENYKNSIIP